MTIQDILDAKGNRVITIPPHHTLHQALCTLVENKVGALVVQDREGSVLGIITERDLMREVYQDTDLRRICIENVMTRNLVIGFLDHEVEYVMSAMTEGRFRHMPVLKDGALVGIVSIGDLVKSKLQHAQDEVIQYKNFVALDWRAS